MDKHSKNNSNRKNQSRAEKVKRRNMKKRVFWISILSVFVIFGVAFGIGYHYLDKVTGESLDQSKIAVTKRTDIEQAMGKENAKNIHKVVNILLLGVDNQEKASDSMMVMTIDETAKRIKLSSLMRDTYVEYGANKINKLNYAYHYGGDEFSVKTVNQQFKLDIKNYIQVDFAGLTNIINYLGGVEINVKPYEVKELNGHASNIARVDKTKFTPIEHSGPQILNGQQATAYCRIRHVGDMDYQRTERQRTVLTKLMDMLLQKPVSSYPSIINEITPYVKTSLTPVDIIKLATSFASYAKNGIQQTRCPYDGLKADSMINKIYYMRWNKEEIIQKLHKFIYLDD